MHAICTLALAALIAFAPAAGAQKGPVKIVVGFPAGATLDLMTRLVAENMRGGLGRPVIVENRAGAQLYRLGQRRSYRQRRRCRKA